MSDQRLTRIVGALAEATGMTGAALNELVRVGDGALLAEVLRISGDRATLQVFEETMGLSLEGPVAPEGRPLAVELGPGLLGAVIDGIGRPLSALAAGSDTLAPGVTAATLDRTRRWAFTPTVALGARVREGDLLGTVPEGEGFEHRVLVPPGTEGTVTAVYPGARTVEAEVARLDGVTPLYLMQRWPVRRPRPFAQRRALDRPFLTGQRVFDFLFPVAEGGTVAVPGGFGTGKTVIEQSLAKYAEADVVVYIGCGERGNEMAEVLHDFATLKDVRTGRSVLARTVLVVNTSNMPVAARESSIYLGLTVAEYFRDQGYRAAVMADSLSRWAEALREIGARLQEMPGEEGYPTYLASRAARLHERAGRVACLGSPPRDGSVTLVSAVSPPGGDFSEPVTQACLRVTGALWALDPALAHQRQFPAVDWRVSYSLYTSDVERALEARVGPEWARARAELVELLARDDGLREVATVVGADALEDKDRVVLELAAIAREALLGQSALDPNDAFSAPEKTLVLARTVLALYRAAQQAVARGVTFGQLGLGVARRALTAMRDSPASELGNASTAAELAIATIEKAGAP